jgi:hypothetical protein
MLNIREAWKTSKTATCAVGINALFAPTMAAVAGLAAATGHPMEAVRNGVIGAAHIAMGVLNLQTLKR